MLGAFTSNSLYLAFVLRTYHNFFSILAVVVAVSFCFMGAWSANALYPAKVLLTFHEFTDICSGRLNQVQMFDSVSRKIGAGWSRDSFGFPIIQYLYRPCLLE